jgi:hypothetical protein
MTCALTISYDNLAQFAAGAAAVSTVGGIGAAVGRTVAALGRGGATTGSQNPTTI